MKKTTGIVLMMAACLSLICSQVSAQKLPGLYLDFNNDGKYDSRCRTTVGASVPVRIYIDGWQDAFPGEKLFGVSMFFHYDKDQIKIKRSGSFANDTDSEEGVFDPSLVSFYDDGNGKIQLEVANFDCVEIDDRLLLYTLEMTPLVEGQSDVMISVDFNEEEHGAVSPAGTDCLKPYVVDCRSSEAVVTVDPVGDNAGGKPCAAAYLLGENDAGLKTLRTFRDTVLSSTEAGRKIIAFYYENSASAVRAMEKNPRIRDYSLKVLEKLLPVINSINNFARQ